MDRLSLKVLIFFTYCLSLIVGKYANVSKRQLRTQGVTCIPIRLTVKSDQIHNIAEPNHPPLIQLGTIVHKGGKRALKSCFQALGWFTGDL